MNIDKENISWKQKKIFEDITTFTLLDYENLPSAILWFAKCNMRCDYCYNKEIVYSNGKISFDEVYSFLKTRVNLLKGVVLCGGEPTFCEYLPQIIKEIKKLGFKIKLDTNGLNIEMIEMIINQIDFISLDFKAPKDKFFNITKVNKYDTFFKSLNLIINSHINHEIRTTFHSQLLSYKDIENICIELKKIDYKKNYYIQEFLENKTYLNSNLLSSSKKEFENLQNLSEKFDFIIKFR